MRIQLLWPILATLLVPLAVAWFVYPEHLPPGFGVFPPQFQLAAPGFNLSVFLGGAAGAIFISALVIWPQKFGFKGAIPAEPAAKQPLPWWFWAGTLVTLFFWWLMWSHSTLFGNLVYWSFTPLWWGFIFVLDGLVYHRNNGVSLFSSRPKLLGLAGLVSILGWVYFEFFDYFVLENWYYPHASVAPWSQQLLSIEFLLTYSTVTPVLFQWYSLLNTFPKLVARYQNGPKMPLNANLLIGVGLALLAAMVLWPYPMFWVVWIGPFLVLLGCLQRLNIWTPFADIAKGNWTAGVLIAVSSMLNGLFWEFWNFGSNYFVTDSITNPNYWQYDIPYLNVIHLFSEMPLLGYFGYLPFGVIVWLFFIWSGKLLGFNTDIKLNNNINSAKID
ncbi:MAG: mechanosensitive ion channel protein MscS [Alkalimonas sp.]|nr:mechanosensitive ion channel protein MscS [Alkalimonas sp.]